jgi:hypothetical protein
MPNAKTKYYNLPIPLEQWQQVEKATIARIVRTKKNVSPQKYARQILREGVAKDLKKT